MSMLPFQQGDIVLWDEQTAVVEEVCGERIVVRTEDDQVHLLSESLLRENQPRRPAA